MKIDLLEGYKLVYSEELMHRRGFRKQFTVPTGGLVLRDETDIRVFAPEPKAWTGEGLPPVGTVCEYRSDRWPEELWEKRTVRYISDFHVITAEEDGIERSVPAEIAQFRPIRTPEQIAAEERDTAVRNIMGLGGIQRQSAEWIYDAGYRKQVQS